MFCLVTLQGCLGAVVPVIAADKRHPSITIQATKKQHTATYMQTSNCTKTKIIKMDRYLEKSSRSLEVFRPECWLFYKAPGCVAVRAQRNLGANCGTVILELIPELGKLCNE